MTANTAHIDSHGRIVIPAAFRRALGLREGDEVMVELEDGTVRILTRAEGIKRAQEIVARRLAGDERSLVDELIEDRRAEAARD